METYPDHSYLGDHQHWVSIPSHLQTRFPQSILPKQREPYIFLAFFFVYGVSVIYQILNVILKQYG